MASKISERGSASSPLASYTGLIVNASSAGVKLSDLISREFLISHDEACDLIDFGSVQVAGHGERNPSYKLVGGEEIRVYWPRGGVRRFYEIDPARILYRDRHLIAYDKEAGIPSQQTPADAYNNVFAALFRYLMAEDAADPYAAIHHRLDRETSGVMVFALDRSANRNLGSAFEHHSIIKDYLAWIDGNPAVDSWVSRDDIGRKGGRYRTVPGGQGKSAETAFRVLYVEENRSLIWARPKTGRTHQIRLHLSAMGHPVIGDRLYGTNPSKRLYLHAYRIKLPHPVDGCELTITAPAPLDWPPPHSVALTD
ncbi:MAG: RluA family pseudouridine synthase [Syntrophobacteraceae bacterium]